MTISPRACRSVPRPTKGSNHLTLHAAGTVRRDSNASPAVQPAAQVCRWGTHALGLALLLCLPMEARAQVTPDFTPLLEAAEEDCAAERWSACRARAELVLSRAPERSALRVRARGLVLLADASEPVHGEAMPLEQALEPLAVAAERAGRADLAHASAYAAALRELAPAGSALVARAEAALAEPPPAAGAVVLPPGYAPPEPEPRENPPIFAGGDREIEEDERPSSEGGYHRRDDGEMVDFYVMSAVAGGGFTAYLFAETGWARDIAPFEEGRVYAVAPVLGAGLFMLLPFGLDQIDHGMPAGVPGAISMGLRFGIGLSVLGLGAGGGLNATDTGHLLFGGTLASALVFGSVAYLTLPHPSQVQMIQNTGLWGGAFGAFLALTIAPHVGATGGQVGSGLGLLGMGSGLLVGSVLSGLDLHLSSGRSWLASLGMLAGAGAGGLVYLLIGGLGGSFDPTIAGVAGLVGSGAGLGLGLWLSEGVQGDTSFGDGVTVSASFAPTDGGGLARIEGTF